MENKETFKLILSKDNYIMEIDPYTAESDSKSFCAVMKRTPKQKFCIKNIKGFRRVVSAGWSYIVELIK